MLYKLSFKLAAQSMLTILSLVMLFHLLVFIQIIPYTIVWAGKINTIAEMRIFEMVSLFINAFIICVIAIKAQYLKWNIPGKLIQVFLWLFVVLFSLNTIGNLVSKTNFETIVFTPLTFILAILCLRIVSERNSKNIKTTSQD